MALNDDNDDSTYKEIDDLDRFDNDHDNHNHSRHLSDNELEHEYEEHQESTFRCSNDTSSNEDASSTAVAANDDSLPESNVTNQSQNSKDDDVNNDTATLLLENVVSSNGSSGANSKGSSCRQSNTMTHTEGVLTNLNLNGLMGLQRKKKKKQQQQHQHLFNNVTNKDIKNRKSSSSSSCSDRDHSSSKKSSNNYLNTGAIGGCCDTVDATPNNNQQSQPLPPTPTSNGARTNQTVSAESITTQTTTAYTDNMKPYADKIAEGKAALEKRDYSNAILIFTDCVDMNSKDYLLYGYRSKAFFKQGQYQQSLLDAYKARDLNPQWTEAYYRQALSLFHLNKHADSLATFSFALSQDADNTRILSSLIQTARQSDIGTNFELEYLHLERRNLHKNPFVVMSVIGHELLSCHHYGQAIVILEAALKIGSTSPRMTGAVRSALSSAHWSLKKYEKSIEYMQEDLEIQILMKDFNGQCRVFGNLGFAYYILKNYEESLKAHRKQLELAMKITGNAQQAIIALNALGHIHVSLNDLNSALLSHTRCLQLIKQQQHVVGDNNSALSRELACVGHIYTLMGQYDKAEEYHSELTNASLISRHEECQTNLVMANSNMAFLAIKNKKYEEARTYHEQVIKMAQRLGGRQGKIYEMRASAGLGHTFRLTNRFLEAEKCFQRQLELALETGDRTGKSQALCNLGMIAQQNNDFSRASKSFSENLALVEDDPHLSAYANSYLGSVYYSKKEYEKAIQFYKKSHTLFKAFECCSQEAATISVNVLQSYEMEGKIDNGSWRQTKQY